MPSISSDDVIITMLAALSHNAPDRTGTATVTSLPPPRHFVRGFSFVADASDAALGLILLFPSPPSGVGHACFITASCQFLPSQVACVLNRVPIACPFAPAVHGVHTTINNKLGREKDLPSHWPSRFHFGFPAFGSTPHLRLSGRASRAQLPGPLVHDVPTYDDDRQLGLWRLIPPM